VSHCDIIAQSFKELIVILVGARCKLIVISAKLSMLEVSNIEIGDLHGKFFHSALD
jgi:hypothetical protein